MVVKKKMGRPAGVKNKAAPSPVSFKHVAEDEARLAQLIELQRMVKSLEHQAIGYRAVISYLEHTISSSIERQDG